MTREKSNIECSELLDSTKIVMREASANKGRFETNVSQVGF